jgi:hypothetical protein
LKYLLFIFILSLLVFYFSSPNNYSLAEDSSNNLHIFWGEEFTHEVGLGEEIILDMRVENIGDTPIFDFTIFMNYEGDYIYHRNSTCKHKSIGQFFPVIYPGEILGCKMILSPVTAPSAFRKVRNDLILNAEIVAQEYVEIYPDIEISLFYEEGELKFTSTHNDLKWLVIREFIFRENYICKRYSFFGLRVEICPPI